MHSTAYEEIVTRIPQLTTDEQFNLVELIRQRQLVGSKLTNSNPSTVRKVPIRSFELELNWLKANREQYRGQWVALKNGQLILSDADGRAFSAKLKNAGVECPFIDYIETETSESCIELPSIASE